MDCFVSRASLLPFSASCCQSQLLDQASCYSADFFPSAELASEFMLTAPWCFGADFGALTS